MNLKVKKIITGLVICFAFIGLRNIKVMAATANISVGSVEASEGETISVPITITAETVMGVAEIYISYDSALLEYNGGEGAGGAGRIKYLIYDFDATGKSKTISISFTAKAAGTAAIHVDSETRILEFEAADPDNSDMQVAPTSGQVKISAPSSASSDCNLSSLSISAVKSSGESVNVEFIPAFSPDVLEYKADLTQDVERLVVSTTLSNQNATTQVSGTRIDPGDNKTNITVVAEDGTQKTYTLYTTRPVAETTSQDETTVNESETNPGIDRSPIYIQSLKKYIIQDFSLVTAPEGFEEGTTTYENKTIASFRGISKSLTLLCIADDTEGTNPVFYIYNEIDGSLNKMINLTTNQKVYTIIPTGEDYVGPEGYIKTTIDINEEIIDAWIKAEGSEFYIIYAMNYDGVSALYVYDKVEQTMQRFSEGNKTDGEVEEPSTDQSAVKSLQNKYNALEKKYEAEKSTKVKVIIGLGVACFVLLLLCIILLFKANIIKEDEDDLDEDDDEKILGEDSDQELKLDMVAQVNEVKPERLAENVNAVMDEESGSSSIDNQEDSSTDTPSAEKEEENKTDSEGKEEKSVDSEYIIDVEEEPFEIEFVDLEDDDN